MNKDDARERARQKALDELHAKQFVEVNMAKQSLPNSNTIFKKCRVPSCDRPSSSLECCTMHYYRLRTHGDTLDSVPVRVVPKKLNLVGQRFGRWEVLSLISGAPSRRYECRCDCGNVREVKQASLRSGESRSCGCQQRGIGYDPNQEYPLAEAKIFGSMRQRCENPANPNYPRYGGRGIQLRFAGVFELIAEIGRRPSPKLTVDRIDNDGHYEPGNVRWATRSQQARNRQITDWCQECIDTLPVGQTCKHRRKAK